MFKIIIKFLTFSLLVSSYFSHAFSNEQLIKSLKEGEKIIFIRHALAPGSGDPSNFKLYEGVVKDNHTGICVNPLSPRDIADVLEGFINLKYDIKKMSESGVKVVKEKYSWKFELKKLLKLYKSLEN